MGREDDGKTAGWDTKGIDMAVQSENERNNVVAEDGHVVAVFNIRVTRTDAAALKQIESR
jgi:hypothetical protein